MTTGSNGNSPADKPRPDYVTSRLRYFDGEFLATQDFVDEQNYHVDRQVRHEACLHAPGILEGLDVTKATGTSVFVSFGSALDAQGNQILVSDADVDSSCDPVEVSLPEDDGDGDYIVDIKFHETQDEPQSGSEGNTRFAQKPEDMLAIGKTPRDGAVPLARVRVTGGAIDGIDTDYFSTNGPTQKYAGLRLPVTDGNAATLRVENVSQDPGGYPGDDEYVPPEYMVSLSASAGLAVDSGLRVSNAVIDSDGIVTAPQYTFPASATPNDTPPLICARAVPSSQGGGADGLRSELILFAQNDVSGNAGPDAITLRAPALRLQTYSQILDGIDVDAGCHDSLYIDPDGHVAIGKGTDAYPNTLANSFEVWDGSENPLLRLSAEAGLRVYAPTTMAGALTAEHQLDVANLLSAKGGLAVTGDATVSGALTAEHALNVSGPLTARNGLTVTGGATVSGALTAENAVNVSGALTVSNASGDTPMLDVSDLAVTAKVGLAAEAGLTVNSALNANGGLEVTGTASVSEMLTAESALNVLGTLSAGGGLTVTGSAAVTGDATVSGALTTEGALNVSGVLSAGDGLTVTGLLTASGGLNVDGTATLEFSGSYREMINLGTPHAIGVQASTTYFRTDYGFAFYQRGTHSDAEQDPGDNGKHVLGVNGNGDVFVPQKLKIGTGESKDSPANIMEVWNGSQNPLLTVSVDGLTVTGDATVSGALTAESALNVSGALSAGSGLTVTGGATVSDALNVTGALNANGGMTLNGASSLFGSWQTIHTSTSRYTAATDGFILAQAAYPSTPGDASSGSISVTVYGANSEEYIGYAYAFYDPESSIKTNTQRDSVTMPVKNGQQFKVVSGDTDGVAPQFNVYWLPLGIGTESPVT